MRDSDAVEYGINVETGEFDRYMSVITVTLLDQSTPDFGRRSQCSSDFPLE